VSHARGRDASHTDRPPGPLRALLQSSVRARLTLWHMLVLAAVLATFALGTYGFLRELTRQRTDHLLQETARAFVHSFTIKADHEPTLDQAAQEAAREFRFSAYRVLVYTENHQLVAVSDSTDVVPGLAVEDLTTAEIPPLHHLLTPASYQPSAYGKVRIGNREMRAYAAAVNIRQRPYFIATLELHHPEEEIVAAFIHSMLIAVPLALLLAGLGGYFLARKSLAPVMEMSEQAVAIGSQSLDHRLVVTNERDELGCLATAFNDLLARLERSFRQQRQFMADASHELRTPIAIMRSETDIVLSGAERSHVDYRGSLEVIREEARRMSRIVEDLFTLARADAGDHPLILSEFYLEEMISDCTRSMRAIAVQQRVSLECAPNTEAPYRGDEALLRRVMLNLIDNAVKHTPPGGRVLVDLVDAPGCYLLSVSDTGPGIPPEAQAAVFERFYQVGRVRGRPLGRTTSGVGLGLAISRWIAEAHGGSLAIASTGPQGSVFTLTLPRPARFSLPVPPSRRPQPATIA
jgi:two-component system, OmpR family, sensor kinase